MESTITKLSRAEEIARVCHEANRAYCESIGDNSQKQWTEAEGWQRESAVKGVEFALSGTRTPREQHEAWMRDKIADGWTYGATKDPVAKTHPCLVEYYDLPESQQRKDALFQAIVSVLR